MVGIINQRGGGALVGLADQLGQVEATAKEGVVAEVEHLHTGLPAKRWFGRGVSRYPLAGRPTHREHEGSWDFRSSGKSLQPKKSFIMPRNHIKKKCSGKLRGTTVITDKRNLYP